MAQNHIISEKPLINVYTKSEVGWVISFPGNGWKPPISTILFTTKDPNWANMTKNDNIFRDSTRKFYSKF